MTHLPQPPPMPDLSDIPPQRQTSMSCDVHILAPPPEQVTVRWDRCHDPKCRRLSPFVTTHYEWYGPTSTCMRCGRQYNEDGMAPLAFSRRARSDNKDDARRSWRNWKARLSQQEINGIVSGVLQRMGVTPCPT